MDLKRLGLVAVIGLIGAHGPAAGESSPGCDRKSDAGNVEARALRGYSEEELKVIRFIADRLEAGDSPRFSAEEIRLATGVTASVLENLDQPRLHQGVIAEMARRGLDVASLAGNCARFSACSIDRDLSGASGEELLRYEDEKAQDGESFDSWTAPDFSLERTTGDTVSLADYRGQSVAVVFLSGHCNHSMETLPVLEQLAEEYAEETLRILPVYINSGSVEDIKSWSSSLGVEMPLLVAEEKDLSETFDFRMVPTVFLINHEGLVTKKLVGQKDKKTLAKALDELIGTKVAEASRY